MKAQRKHEQCTETERESQRRRPDIAVFSLCFQQMAPDHVGHRQHITMETHGRFRLAGGTGGDSQQTNIVARRVDILKLVAIGPCAGGELSEFKPYRQQAGLGCRIKDVLCESIIVKRMADLCLARNLHQFRCPQ